MPADKVLNPLDVEGLEKSLSDSATRVSTIWITYLLFGLYLIVTAGTATPKQLLLADPVKLPALGTDVPLVSFFVLSPIFFVLLQIYVLLQTLLLGRTAKAYNYALNATLADKTENAIFRERLANTIFAQIFAGAPREREGWMGGVLRGIRWFTLVGSPILMMLTFQFAFLPYHSWQVTWVHRLLIYIEVAMVFTLWPAVINPAKEFAWYRLDFRFWKSIVWSWRNTQKKHDNHSENLFKRARIWFSVIFAAVKPRLFAQLVALALLIFSTIFVSFPGEPHINVIRGRDLFSHNCERWMTTRFKLDEMIVVDRLYLKDVGVIDADTFDKMKKDTPGHMYDGARSKDLTDRNFICGKFEGVDFRRAALENAQFDGSTFVRPRFDGARLSHAVLTKTNLNGVELNSVKLDSADMRGAILYNANLDDVDLTSAHLEGIDLSQSTFAAVSFGYAANLSGANLIGLKTKDSEGKLKDTQSWEFGLKSAHLEGASLQYADLSKFNLAQASLDGSDLFEATMPPKAKIQVPDSAFLSQNGWDDQKDEQKNFAATVVKAICVAPTPTDNTKPAASTKPDPAEAKKQIMWNYRAEIVAGVIRNALYPRRDPACNQTQAGPDDNSKCVPEQPDSYRLALIDDLKKCSPLLLSAQDEANLTAGRSNGNTATKP